MLSFIANVVFENFQKTSTFQENRLGDMHQEQPMNAPWFGNGQAVVIDELPAFGAWPEWPESSGDEFAGLLAAAENTPSTSHTISRSTSHQCSSHEGRIDPTRSSHFIIRHTCSKFKFVNQNIFENYL